MSELVFQHFSATAPPCTPDQGTPQLQPDPSNQQAPPRADLSDSTNAPTTQHDAQQQGHALPLSDMTTTPPIQQSVGNDRGKAAPTTPDQRPTAPAEYQPVVTTHDDHAQ